MDFQELRIGSLREFYKKELPNIKHIRWVRKGTQYKRAIEAVHFAFIEALQVKEKTQFIKTIKGILDTKMLYEVIGQKLNNFFSQVDRNSVSELVKDNAIMKTYIGDILLRMLHSDKPKGKSKIHKEDITSKDWEAMAEKLKVNIEIYSKIKKKEIYKTKDKAILEEPLRLFMKKEGIGILYVQKEDNLPVEGESKNDDPYYNYIGFILNVSREFIEEFKKDIEELTKKGEELGKASKDSYGPIKKELDKKVKGMGNRLRQTRSKCNDKNRFLYTFCFRRWC